MKSHWIILSVVVITTIAYLDMKDRFQELDSIAANTQVQVEMKDSVPKNTGLGIQPKVDSIEKQPMLDDKRIHQKINENTMKLKPKGDSQFKQSAPSGLVNPTTPQKALP